MNENDFSEEGLAYFFIGQVFCFIQNNSEFLPKVSESIPLRVEVVILVCA